WRWCRRNPVVASLSAALLLVLTVTAVGGVVMSLRLGDSLRTAQNAELEGKRRLFQSYISEADAKRLSQRPGQRFGTLRRVRDALEISREIGISAEDKLRLRNIAIAALCLPDMSAGAELPSTAFMTAPSAELCLSDMSAGAELPFDPAVRQLARAA